MINFPIRERLSKHNVNFFRKIMNNLQSHRKFNSNLEKMEFGMRCQSSLFGPQRQNKIEVDSQMITRITWMETTE